MTNSHFSSFSFQSQPLYHIKMEKASSNSISLSVSLPDFVGFLFSHTILNWAVRFLESYIKFLSFLQCQVELIIAKSKIRIERRNLSCETDDKKNVLNKHFCYNEKEDFQLTREDIEMVMEKMGMLCNTEEDQLKECLSSSELSLLFEEKEPSLEEVNAAFSLFDKNGDGFIDVDELRRVLCNLGFKQGLNVDECERMIRAFDDNGDGRIDFNEFVKLMENDFC